MIEFGVCADAELGKEILTTGFDFVEIRARDLLTLPLEKFSGLRTAASNLFFEPAVRLYGRDETQWLEPACEEIDRANQLCVKVMVIGSAHARNSCSTFPVKQAEASFLEIIATLQNHASQYGIVIAPEPLNSSESDVWNSTSALAHATKKSGLNYAVDSYHSLKQAEINSSDIKNYEVFWESEIPHLPAHVHFANLQRQIPEVGDVALKACARRLRQIGYDSRISLECKDLTNLSSGLITLKALFEI